MDRFSKVYLEITNVCNLSCDFCPKTYRAPAFMSESDFRDTLDQLRPFTRYLYFHVKGEPLLHPELSSFLDISLEKGFQVNITTNGTLISKQQDMLLSKPALRQINFSLHSFDGNELCQSREDYVGDILNFAKKAQSHSQTIVSLRLWNLTGPSDNDDAVEDHPPSASASRRDDELASRRNNELLSAIEKSFDLTFDIRDEILPTRGIKLAERVYLNQAELFEWPDPAAKEYPGSAFCYGLRNQAAILVDGTVVPCCLDGEGVMALGNVHDTPFGEIIESARARAIFDGFSRKEAVEELCKRCGYRRRFNT